MKDEKELLHTQGTDNRGGKLYDYDYKGPREKDRFLHLKQVIHQIAIVLDRFENSRAYVWTKRLGLIFLITVLVLQQIQISQLNKEIHSVQSIAKSARSSAKDAQFAAEEAQSTAEEAQSTAEYNLW